MPPPPSAYSAFPEQRTAVPPDAWDDWEEDYSRDEQPTTEQAKNARLWQDARLHRQRSSATKDPQAPFSRTQCFRFVFEPDIQQ
ncbi:hypothetical protein JCM10296v2_005397 [Rhodotorula toruloides]